MAEYIDYEPELDNDFAENHEEEEELLSESGSIIDDTETGNDLSFYRSLN